MVYTGLYRVVLKPDEYKTQKNQSNNESNTLIVVGLNNTTFFYMFGAYNVENCLVLRLFGPGRRDVSVR